MSQPAPIYTITFSPAGELAKDFSVIDAAFGNRAPFVNIFFPNHDTPAGHEQGTRRLTAWQKSDGNAHFLRAVATPDYPGTPPNEGVLAHAIWTFTDEPPPSDLGKVEDVEKVWGALGQGDERRAEEEMQFMRQIWSQYVVPRSEAVQDGNGKGCWGMFIHVSSFHIVPCFPCGLCFSISFPRLFSFLEVIPPIDPKHGDTCFEDFVEYFTYKPI